MKIRPHFLLVLLASACGGPSDPSHLNVTNGRPVADTDADASSIVELGNGLYSCTGTFLTPTVLLTAAHCLDRGLDGQGKPSVSVVATGFTPALKTFYNQTYFDLVARQAGLDQTSPYDMALAIFPAGTAAQLHVSRYRHLTAKAPAKGDSVTFIGFGHNDMVNEQGAGLKRWGSNKIMDMDDQLLAINGTSLPGAGNGLDANIGSGDSGGPLLNADGDLIGVSVAVSQVQGDRHDGFFVNARGDLGQQLFRNAAHCGAPPCADVQAADPQPTTPTQPTPPPTVPPSETGPHGVCRYRYDFDQTITNGNKDTVTCYSHQVAKTCDPGYSCTPPPDLATACPKPTQSTAVACK